MSIYKKHKAQSIVEYVLPLFFIAGISYAVWGSVANNESLSLSNVFSPTTLPTVTTLGTGTLGANSGSNIPNKPYTQNVFLKMSDGSVIVLSNFPKESSKIIETMGVSGYTTQMATALIDFTEKLMSAKQLSKEEYVSFMALANVGFQISSHQKWIESEIAQNPGTCWETLSKKDVSASMGYAANLQSILNYVDGPFTSQQVNEALVSNSLDKLYTAPYQASTNGFIREYGELKNNGSLNDPIVKAVVDSLTASILSGAMSMSKATGTITDSTNIADLGQFYSKAYSKATTKNSIDICNSGNSKMNGLTCEDND